MMHDWLGQMRSAPTKIFQTPVGAQCLRPLMLAFTQKCSDLIPHELETFYQQQHNQKDQLGE